MCTKPVLPRPESDPKWAGAPLNAPRPEYYFIPGYAGALALHEINKDAYQKFDTCEAAKAQAAQQATTTAAAAAQQNFVNGGSTGASGNSNTSSNPENKNTTTNKTEDKLTDNPLFWVLVGIVFLGLAYKAFAKPAATAA